MKKILLSLFLISSVAFGSATRIMEADSLVSADKTKSYALPAASDTLTGRASTDSLTNKTLVVASNTVTTAASGNLAATSLNAALAELQSDIDTRVTGPASATDKALTRFNATTGKLVQDSLAILSDAGVLTGLTGITSTGTATLSNATLSGSLEWTSNTADATATGASANITSATTVVTRLTNASLTSVGGYADATAGRYRIIINNTGNSITIKNEDTGVTAANRILTGSNADFVLANNGSIVLIYNATIARNMLLGGTGDVTAAGTQTLTNKTISGASNTFSQLPIATQFIRDSFAGNSSTTIFTLSQTPAVSAQVEVFVDGILQIVTTDYSISGTSLTFVTAPETGQDIKAIYSRY